VIKLWRLFVDDGRLAAGILACVGLCALLARLRAELILLLPIALAATLLASARR
jgi:hypothetical protein